MGKDFKTIDLKLPKDKKPGKFTGKTYSFSKVVAAVDKDRKTSALGSNDEIYGSSADTGLFGVIFDAWSNHWNVRTSPEDWWLPIITRVATAIDNQADTDELRKYFRNGKQEKEKISIQCPNFSIYDTDYKTLFGKFASEISKRIEVQGYVSTITSDFSTSTPEQAITSQISIMKSFQKYFEYEMMICGCGIHSLEMCGTEDDWKLLGVKLESLRKLLLPIEEKLVLKEMFKNAREVYEKLLKTYKGNDMSDWWSKVLIQGKEYEYGPSGMRKSTQVDCYNGWIVSFCSSYESLNSKTLSKGDYKELSCLSTCPMKIVDAIRKIDDEANLVAGMLGYKKYGDNDVVTLEAFHGWSMLLPSKSPLRNDKNE